MDSEIGQESIFDTDLPTVPMHFIESQAPASLLPGSSRVHPQLVSQLHHQPLSLFPKHTLTNGASELEDLNLPNVLLPDLEINRPVSAPFVDRPLIPHTFFHAAQAQVQVDGKQLNTSQLPSNGLRVHSSSPSTSSSSSSFSTEALATNETDKGDEAIAAAAAQQATALLNASGAGNTSGARKPKSKDSTVKTEVKVVPVVASMSKRKKGGLHQSSSSLSKLASMPVITKQKKKKVRNANNKNSINNKSSTITTTTVAITDGSNDDDGDGYGEEDNATTGSVVTGQRANVSHTRKCRAKVNNYFEKLMQVLPAPPQDIEVKHKAQILHYAIDKFHSVRQYNMKLEMQLALSSPRQMKRWVYSVVHSSKGNLNLALKSFMALICLIKHWKYAELWSPSMAAETEVEDKQSNCVLRYVTGAVSPSVEGDELHRLRNYRSESRNFIFYPRSGVPGRVYLTRKPEWLPLLNDPIAFPRAPHAVHNKIQVTFAVPIIVNGSVKMVVQFYDLVHRDYDSATLNIANEIAELFGKAFSE